MSGLSIAKWALHSVLIEGWKTQSQHIGLSCLVKFETLLDYNLICRNLFVVGLIKLGKFSK